MIAILNYGLGNLKSIYNMFKKIGVKSIITNDLEEIKNANKYILPGVGSFDAGILKLKNSTFLNTLENEIFKNKKKILGICLGMQLLGNSSEEGLEKGLGWINAYSKKFDAKEKFMSLPIMGWNKISIKKENKLLNDLNDCRFYFLHSYHVHCQNDDDIIATTDYVKEYNCCISKKNIYGVQFHPEKSHKYGMKLLKNFSEI